MLRDGIAAILKQVEDFDVVGGLSSGEEAVNHFQDYHPDVILMDIVMGGMNGLEATRWIKEQNKEVKIVIISSEITKQYVATGIKCGIDSYLPKDANKETLITAIRTVMKGEKYFNQAITNLVFEDFYQKEKDGKKRERSVSTGLTKRENEILERVAFGKSNQEVADSLYISIKTVETHKTNILEKLGLRNTAELVRYAIKNNIITLE
jgi:DNA-binding NarL/FixJ family response regulator